MAVEGVPNSVWTAIFSASAFCLMIEVWICCCVPAACMLSMLETIAIISITQHSKNVRAPYPGTG